MKFRVIVTVLLFAVMSFVGFAVNDIGGYYNEIGTYTAVGVHALCLLIPAMLSLLPELVGPIKPRDWI